MLTTLINAACVRAQIELQAMIAANQERERRGHVLAYNEDAFSSLQQRLEVEIYELRQTYS